MPLNTTDTYTGPAEASQAIATSFLAPAYVGYILQFMLFGSFVTNFFAYIGTSTYRDDRRTNKLYWAVLVLCTVATALNVFEAVWHAIDQNRSADELYMSSVPDALTPMVTGTIGLVVQSFLTLRASRLFHRQRIWRAVFLAALAPVMLVAWLGSIGAGIASLGFTYNFVHRIESTGLNYNKMIGTWMWLSAAVDVTLSATLFLSIRKHLDLSENGDTAIRRIMHTAALTASYTTFFAVVGAFMSVVFPQDNLTTVDILFAFDLPLAALYSISLLTTLASRKPLLQTSVPVAYPSFHVGNNSGSGGGQASPASPRGFGTRDEKRAAANGFADVSLQAYGVTVTKEVAREVDFADEIEMSPTRRPSEKGRPKTPLTQLLPDSF